MSARSEEEQRRRERLAQLRERLDSSRADIFALAHAIKGDEPPPASEPGERDGQFPQSRIMRALLGPPGRTLLSGAAVAVTLLRPKVLWGALRLTPMLRPLVMRYLLPRLLGQR